tara:strand:+ start:65 stop:886 length:822 start_codon:yes stop_codon:yes gene_type:complete
MDKKMYIKYNLDDQGIGHVFKRNNLIVKETSKYQTIEISELEILGKVLVLDNIIQLSELDCDRYHEAFAHIPVSNLTACERALILGGGDGILAKELLKYPNLKVDMVDIDEKVCNLSKQYLFDLNDNVFENEELNLYIDDALNFCKKAKERDLKYDIIFADITDPHPESPSRSLLSDSSIELYKSILNKSGLLVSQTDNVQIAPNHSKNIKNKFNKHFNNVGEYGIVALTLSSVFSFVYASDSKTIEEKPISVNTNWLNKKRFTHCLNILDLH